MKTIEKNRARTWVLILSNLLIVTSSFGQNAYKQTGTSSMTIAGTSTMHDWTMESKDANYTASIELNEDGTIAKINSVNLVLAAESLKSGKGAMDKNAYNSLKTDKHKQITFQATSSKISGKSIVCNGNLTIAGVTKPIEVTVTYDNRTGGFGFKGSKKFKMSEYGVEPPTFMFGSIKTGDEITIAFDVTLSPIKL